MIDPVIYCNVTDLTPAEKLSIIAEYTEFEQLQRLFFLQGSTLIAKPTPEELLQNCGYSHRKRQKRGKSSPNRRRTS